jgi:folate-binding protein YgfZ
MIMGPPALDLLVPAGATGSWLERLASAGATTVDAEAFDVVRIGQGLPWFGPDLSADVIPLEAHLDDWVSITKGCYPGQEVVARIQNLGSVARKLVRLSVPGEVALEPGELAGTGERSDKTAGVLTSVAYDPVDDITRALGYVRRAYWKTGSHVRAGEIELDVFALDG